MKKEVELSDIVILGIVLSTLLAILKTLGIIAAWWVVPIPFIIAAVVIIAYIIIILIDEFKY